MTVPATSDRPSITESPWYWVYLFCAAGAVALLLAGPKFASRQAQIERNYEARQRAAQHVAGREFDDANVAPVTNDSSTRITLWPLYAILGAVLSIAWFKLWRRQAARPNEKTPIEQTPVERRAEGES